MTERDQAVGTALRFCETPPDHAGDVDTGNTGHRGDTAENSDDCRGRFFAHAGTMRYSLKINQAIIAKDIESEYMRKTRMADEKIAQWLSEQLERKGVSQSALARALGLHPTMINKVINGRRRLTVEEMTAAARFLEAPPPIDTGSSQDAAASTPQNAYRSKIPVLGTVAAGIWREVDDETFDPIPIPPDPGLPPDALYGLIVHGTSINRIAEEGDIVVCLDHAKVGFDISEGDLVVVERRRHQEGLREVTAKRVRRKNGSIELWPDSNDPRWQEPILLNPSEEDSDDMEVRLLARIEWIYRPVKRR